jgi:hypothetical protein
MDFSYLHSHHTLWICHIPDYTWYKLWSSSLCNLIKPLLPLWSPYLLLRTAF